MTQKVLHITNDDTTEATLLADRLDPAQFEPRTIHLRSRGPLDFRAIMEVRRQLADFRPGIVHAWGRRAFWAASMARKLVRNVSARFVVTRGVSSEESWPHLDHWLLRSADRIVIDDAEAERTLGLGLAEPQVVCIQRAALPDTAAVDRRIQLPAQARYIACCGPFDSFADFREALWAFDILRYLYNDLHLLMIGTGPAVGRIETFIRDAHMVNLVHLADGHRRPALKQAELVWILGETGCDTAALDALGAGRPIVAVAHAVLAGLIQNDVTGLLIPPGQPVLLARKTARLLNDRDLAERLATAARDSATHELAPETMVNAYVRLYQDLITAGRAAA
jgi:glycosyltransferase involved in cell wall biosynthesis